MNLVLFHYRWLITFANPFGHTPWKAIPRFGRSEYAASETELALRRVFGMVSLWVSLIGTIKKIDLPSNIWFFNFCVI